jgi:hypothetical protein
MCTRMRSKANGRYIGTAPLGYSLLERNASRWISRVGEDRIAERETNVVDLAHDPVERFI